MLPLTITYSRGALLLVSAAAVHCPLKKPPHRAAAAVVAHRWGSLLLFVYFVEAGFRTRECYDVRHWAGKIAVAGSF